MSSKQILIAAIAGAVEAGLGWKNLKPKAAPEIEAKPIRPYRAERPPVDARSRTAAAAERRARQKAKRAEHARRQREGMQPRYTPEMAGSGQRGICDKCGLPPTPEGHDGCLGTLPEKIVMNACCGHGNERQAYIQYWDGTDTRGTDAIHEQNRLLSPNQREGMEL